MVDVGQAHLVEQHDGLHHHEDQQHQRGEDVDGALGARADRGPQKVDRDVAAAVAGGGDAPEDQDRQQHAAEVVGVGNGGVEELAQHH